MIIIKVLVGLGVVIFAGWAWGAIHRQIEKDKRNLLNRWAKQYRDENNIN